MRLIAVIGLLCLVTSLTPAQAPKKDPPKKETLAKAIIGKWTIETFVNGKPGKSDLKLDKWIEFRDDGTFSENSPARREGTYKLNGNSVILTAKGPANMTYSTTYNITLKDGKITHTLAGTTYNLWTKVEEKREGDK